MRSSARIPRPRSSSGPWTSPGVGLKPILRTAWAPRGQRPRAVVRPRYEWLYVAAFVRPETGDTSFWLIPEVNAEVFRLLVHAFA